MNTLERVWSRRKYLDKEYRDRGLHGRSSGVKGLRSKGARSNRVGFKS